MNSNIFAPIHGEMQTLFSCLCNEENNIVVFLGWFGLGFSLVAMTGFVSTERLIRWLQFCHICPIDQISTWTLIKNASNVHRLSTYSSRDWIWIFLSFLYFSYDWEYTLFVFIRISTECSSSSGQNRLLWHSDVNQSSNLCKLVHAFSPLRRIDGAFQLSNDLFQHVLSKLLLRTRQLLRAVWAV